MKIKSLLVAVIMTVVLLGGAGTYSVMKKADKQMVFQESGYIIDTLDENDFSKHYFKANTKYEYCYPNNITYRDINGKTTKADVSSFVHYSNGALSALSDGVLIDLNMLD